MNGRKFLSPLTIFLIITVLSSAAWSEDLVLNNVPVKVFFSPSGGCTTAVIDEINSAKSEILVQAYSFTLAPIAKALFETHKRGVKVEAILDKSQKSAQYTSATFLANSRIPTFIDDRHAIAHNKIIVIDMRVIAIVNQKGGSGKTTVSVNLAAALVEQQRKALLVDIDPQANGSRWFGSKDEDRGLLDLFVNGGNLLDFIRQTPFGVDVAPSSTWMIQAEKQLIAGDIFLPGRAVQRVRRVWV